MGGIAGQQHPPVAVGRRLAGHVGEPGDPVGAAQAKVAAVDNFEGGAQVVEVGAAVAELPFGQHHAHQPVVTARADAVGAKAVVSHPHLGFAVHHHLGDDPAGGCIHPDKIDAGGSPDRAAATVASHQKLAAQHPAIGQFGLDAVVVLDEAGHVGLPVERHPELVDPAGQDRLEVLLPQRQHVGVAGREIGDIQPEPGVAEGRVRLPSLDEPIDDAALVEHLERAGMQPTRPGAVQALVRPPFDDGDIDARERQFSRQHQTGRATSYDNHRMLSRRRVVLVHQSLPCSTGRADCHRPVALLVGAPGSGSR